MQAKTSTTGSRLTQIESLETRTLFANLNWYDFAILDGQATETNNYPLINGLGQNVAIVDHGIDASHPSIGGGAGVGPNNRIIYAYNFADNSAAPSDVQDYDGHGTGVSGIIGEDVITYNGLQTQGIAQGSKQLSLKTGDKNDPGAESHIKAALDWIIGHYGKYHISVVNLTDFLGSGYSEPVYQPELQTLRNLGIFVASPVGNVPGTEIAYPAKDPNDIGVGGISSDNTMWGNTQTGPDLKLLAPGNQILQTYDDYSYITGKLQIVTPYATGTSFATAHVSGLALLMKQIDPSIPVTQMLQIMQQSGSPVVDNLVTNGVTDQYSGTTYYRINFNNAVAMTYAQRDDAYANYNNRAKHALYINTSTGSGSISNLKALVGETKWHYFKVGATSSVSVSIKVNKSLGIYPNSMQLLDGNGKLVANIPAAGYTATLAAGTYYVVAAAGTQSVIGYSVNVSIAKPKATAAIVMAAQNPFVTADAAHNLFPAGSNTDTSTIDQLLQ